MSPTHPELKALREFAEKNAGFMKDKYGNVTQYKARVEVVSFRSINPVQLGLGSIRKAFRLAVNKVFALLGKEERVETVYINPNRRSHDKILIVDQNFPELAVAMIGGRNISDSYYGVPKVDENTYNDLEVIVKNDPAALKKYGRNAITTNIADLYDQLYFHSANRIFSTGAIRKLFGFNRQYRKMDEGAATIAQQTLETQKQLGEDSTKPDFGKNYLSTGFVNSQVDLAYSFDNVLRSIDYYKLDPNQSIERKYNVNNIALQFEKYLAEEKEHIMIVSPYLWLDPVQIQKFKVWLGMDPARKLTIITNSIMTSDNMLAQTLVDAVLGPQFLLDRSYVDPKDNKTYEYNQDQMEIYEYGRLDSTDLGGTKPYGKLHAKGVYMKSLQGSAITTYNADPRSQYLNSETGLIIFSPEHSEQVRTYMEKLISESHKWGSFEYHAIRKHEKLSSTKRKIGENVNELYQMIIKLRLAWLI